MTDGSDVDVEGLADGLDGAARIAREQLVAWQGLRADPDLRADRLRRGIHRPILTKMIKNHLHRTLTLLDRKRLELARALATRPKLLLLDEIAGGLTEPETHELVDEIRRVKEQGVTIVWIEHVVHALLAVADRLLVIHFGKHLAEGSPAAVMDDPEVKRVYLGLEA